MGPPLRELGRTLLLSTLPSASGGCTGGCFALLRPVRPFGKGGHRPVPVMRRADEYTNKKNCQEHVVTTIVVLLPPSPHGFVLHRLLTIKVDEERQRRLYALNGEPLGVGIAPGVTAVAEAEAAAAVPAEPRLGGQAAQDVPVGAIVVGGDAPVTNTFGAALAAAAAAVNAAFGNGAAGQAQGWGGAEAAVAAVEGAAAAGKITRWDAAWFFVVGLSRIPAEQSFKI